MRVASAVIAGALFAGACGNDTIATPATTTSTRPATTIPSTTTTTLAPPSPTTVPDLPVAFCDDIAEPVPDVIGTLSGMQNVGDAVKEAMQPYIEAHRDTYAGRWTARDYGGTFVVAFTDDPEFHLEAILALPTPTGTIADSGYAVDTVQLQFSEAELDAMRPRVDALFDHPDLTIWGTGRDTKHNRISIDMATPTVDDIELLATLVPVDIVCIDGALADPGHEAPTVDDPLTMMADADPDDPLVTCGTPPFRASALDGAPDIDPNADDPVILAFYDSFDSPEMAGFPRDGWRTLSRSEELVVLGHFEDPGSRLILSIEAIPVGWRVGGLSAGGECELRLVWPEGLGRVEFGLDPQNPPDPEATTFQVLAKEVACSGSRDATDFFLAPEVIETDAEVRLALASIPPLGPQTCPGNPHSVLTIELEAPLGDRVIVDGTRVPPVPVATGLDL